jgi:Flp pilus assembly pilin Flp
VRRTFGAMRRFISDDNGATAIEYGLIAAGIFLAIVPPMSLIATRMGLTYNKILDYFSSV